MRIKVYNITLIYGRIAEISAPYGSDCVGHNGLSRGRYHVPQNVLLVVYTSSVGFLSQN